jgi:hypothetical protein
MAAVATSSESISAILILYIREKTSSEKVPAYSSAEIAAATSARPSASAGTLAAFAFASFPALALASTAQLCERHGYVEL